MTKGYFTFVLHSHLPWVLGHGRWPHGTDWLNEAIAECYIPLLNKIIQLADEGYHPRLNIGITPILQEQLRSPILINEFEYYLKNKIEAADNDIKEFSKKNDIDSNLKFDQIIIKLRQNGFIHQNLETSLRANYLIGNWAAHGDEKFNKLSNNEIKEFLVFIRDKVLNLN